MEIRIRETGEVVSERQFRAYAIDRTLANGKELTFPDTLTAAMITANGGDPVLPAPQPTVDEFQTVESAEPVKDNLGNWVQGWKVRSWPQSEIDAYRSSGRLERWQAIKAHRDFLEGNGIFVAGQWFHSDEKSLIKLLGLKDRARDRLAAGGSLTDQITVLGQPVAWQSIDNIPVPLTVQLAFDLVNAVGELQARLFAIAKIHRAQMEAAQNPRTYNFLATAPNWPPTYVPPQGG